MEKIILKRNPEEKKPRRAAVTIKAETYQIIRTLSFDLNMPIETLVEILLTEALKMWKL